MEGLSRSLFALRKQRKLSREAVARALEMSAMTYQRYEKKSPGPYGPGFGEACRVLWCNPGPAGRPCSAALGGGTPVEGWLRERADT